MDEFKNLNRKVKNALTEFGIKRPTLIQRRAIPRVLERKNTLLVAPTGTGKTEAAILPIFSQFSEEKSEGIKIVYIAPLRALNRDILDRLRRWEKYLDIDIQVRHGDTPRSQRRKQAENPPDMLITTPESLQAILPGSRMKEHLESVGWVVVDEVHELAESKRGTQLTLALERLENYAKNFQRIGLSATVGNEQEIGNFLSGSDREIELISTVTEEEISIGIESPMPSEEDIEVSEELNAEPSTIARIRRIKELMKEHDSTLTFVNTRRTVETLGSKLKIWEPDLSVNVHHGSLSRDFRINSEEEFREGDLKSLISTSSMELGIDIGTIDFVIQHRSPRQVKRMIQRIGRSGHEIGGISEGVVIATDPDDALESIVISEKTLDRDIEPTEVHEKSFDVLSHQMVGMSLDGIEDPKNIFQIVKKAYPYKDLTEDEFYEVLNQLQNEGILWRDEEQVGRSGRSWKYYYSNLSMIPDIKKYSIVDMVSGESIGSLDEEFVVGYAEPGATFICKGEAWRVVEVESDRIRVEPTQDPYGAIPAWEGELIPVSFDSALRVGGLRRKINELIDRGSSDEEIARELSDLYPSDSDTLEWAVDYIRRQKSAGVVPTDKTILIEIYEKFAVVHAPFGSKVNRTCGEILSALMTTRIGESVRFRTDPYRIAFRFPRRSDAEKIKDTFEDLKPEYIGPLLEKVLNKSSVFRWRLLHVAKRFGAISQDADFSEIGRRYLETFEDTPLWTEARREILHEKMDVGRLKELLERFQSGELTIETLRRGESQGPSPMGLTILNELARSGEIAMPERAERKILEALERRLKNQQVRLFCLHCLDWSTLTRVRRLSEKPKCPKCEARLLGLIYGRSEETKRILKKDRKGESLNEEERKELKRVRKSADLILTHGKKAIFAMAARGVGPETASRLLGKQYKSRADFLKDIHRAEREYARTHRFWD